MVTVRTRFGSVVPGDDAAGANAGAEACACKGGAVTGEPTGEGGTVVKFFNSTGCSSRDTTRSFAP